MNCGDLVRKAAMQFAENEAIWCEGRSLTYREVYDRSCRLTNALRALGIRPGDSVATLGPNGTHSLEKMTGLSLGGYVRLPLHGRNTAHQHRYMLELVRARALIVDRASYDQVARLHDEVACLESILVYGADTGDGTDAGIGSSGTDNALLSYESLLAAAEPTDPLIPIAEGDPSHFAFTSGTTGNPKAAVHTHRSWLSIMEQYLLSLAPLSEDDQYLAVAPLSHAASTVLYGVLSRGACCVAMPSFDVARAAQLIEARHITFTLMVPTMIQMLVNDDVVSNGRHDLSSLRILLATGAPLNEPTIRRVHEVLGDVLYQSYGQSEGVPFSVMTPADYARALYKGQTHLLGSVGRPTPRTIIRIIDDQGEPLPVGAEGEIVADSPTLMVRFWENEAATAERFAPDGALMTRDVGHLDEHGYLYISDRKGDMIISGGYNIWPAEIENAIASHPDVAEVAVFGIAHANWGETPCAVVVPRQGCAISEEDLLALCRDRIGSMKKPSRIIFQDTPLPKSAVGKVLRRVLRDRYYGNSTADQPTSAG